MIKANWDTEELIENWTFLPQELELVNSKVGANQIGLAVLLKYFQIYARFPNSPQEIPETIISYIAQQLQIPDRFYSDYDWQGRSISNHRASIRKLFGFRTATIADGEEMVDWLKAEIIPNEQRIEPITELVYQRWRELQIEPPTPGRVERLIRSAIAQHEADFCQQTLDKLTPEIIEQIDILLSTEETEELENAQSEKRSIGKIKMSDLAFLKTDPGAVGLGSFLTEIEKLRRIRAVGLPTNLFEGRSPKLVKTYRQRAATETPYLLRQHQDAIRYTLMAAFCIQRSQEITDNLIEILIQIIHRLDSRASKRINQQLIDEFKKVSGKTGLLFRIAEVAIAEPEGVIEQVIFPVVSHQTLKDLVAEYKATGIAYRRRVHNVMRASFAGHYRRMIPQLLSVLEFRSNNDLHRPVIEALELLKKYSSSKARYYDSTEEIPIDGVLKSNANKHVTILSKGNKGLIRLSPFDTAPEPVNIKQLKGEINRLWHKTSLLDILKETDLRVDFTRNFKSMGTREILDRETLQKRLLLCLFGMGTNTGLKRINTGIDGENYQDLLYVRRRYIHKDQLHSAIAEVVNAIFEIRLPHIWGEGTTSCASDSKHFGAWEQNLITQYHLRYGGRGVMIYWHVEKNSTCIYSQLKTCSSSEVAAMINGVLKHCTSMEVQKNYVDSHGQSEVAFAFTHLLGFQLMPRLKRIKVQKLYRPHAGQADAYSNLQPILTRPINWDLIRQQYDQMVKYATALRLGTAETEAILKRFSKNPFKHPTYLALMELGRVIKTIFLCQYLDSEAVRREINEGLNVVERWNGVNDFIFYGKGGEFASNRLESQELSVLSLHLLQICLVYVNTLMIQSVLAQKHWEKKLTATDLRAITPLIFSHVNPYGLFKLDMKERISKLTQQ